MADQLPTAEWQQQLDALLGHLTDADPTADATLAASLGGLDPALVAFLLQQIAEQDTPEAAAFLEIVAAQHDLPGEARTLARDALARLAESGVTPAAPEADRFLAGYIQQNRQEGEQILLLGWRIPSGEIEALVFLLNWRGAGLRDYYATHTLTDAQWTELIEHNAEKDAPLAEVTLAGARALLEAAIAESRRYAQELPREYKLAPNVIERRVFGADIPTADRPPLVIAPDLAPDDLVAAYVEALRYRDYALAVELLAEGHPSRANRTHAEAAEALRVELKHAPRRDENVDIVPDKQAAERDERRVLLATGAEVAVQQSGKRIRTPVRERYTVARHDNAWRIERIERLS
jgi:hypothetical protein